MPCIQPIRLKFKLIDQVFSKREKVYCPDVKMTSKLVGQLFSLETAFNFFTKKYSLFQKPYQFVKSEKIETFCVTKQVLKLVLRSPSSSRIRVVILSKMLFLVNLNTEFSRSSFADESNRSIALIFAT